MNALGLKLPRIVLGIAPGLNALAYSVIIAFDQGKPDPVDADVLHARPLSAATAGNLPKRARVHQLVLGVVAERYRPVVVAIGPPAEPGEESLHVAAAVEMLVALASWVGVPVIRFTLPEILEQLGCPESKLGRRVHRGLARPLGTRDKRIVLATGVAMAAARQTAMQNA